MNTLQTTIDLLEHQVAFAAVALEEHRPQGPMDGPFTMRNNMLRERHRKLLSALDRLKRLSMYFDSDEALDALMAGKSKDEFDIDEFWEAGRIIK